MRSHKRRPGAVSTAAKPQPALKDAIFDAANRKGLRCCVECGATSTPQWREGPMGPKTLCNACGVRRQRLLRKHQAATAGHIPTAPVTAVQARRQAAGRPTLQDSPLESDEVLFGLISVSEHSSDETEGNWGAAMPAKQHVLHQHQQEQQQQIYEVDERCNEDESAAYDLLFFAGVECVGGGGAVTASHGDDEPKHGHNTRRHAAQPARRADDCYYYYNDASGLEGSPDIEVEEDGSYKRRRIGAAQPVKQSVARMTRARVEARPWLAGASLCATEGVAESELWSQLENCMHQPCLQPQLYLQPQPYLQGERQQQQYSIGTYLPDEQREDPTSLGLNGNTVSSLAPIVGASAASISPSSSVPAAGAALPPPAPFLTMPAALPVLPLSLPGTSLPAVTAQDCELLLKLQLDFQRACLQLHQANVACEEVSAVVAEHRRAAASAHEAAAAASQQLAAEARGVTERYGLRDVLTELHSATAAAAAAGAGGNIKTEPAAAAAVSEVMQGWEQQREVAGGREPRE